MSLTMKLTRTGLGYIFAVSDSDGEEDSVRFEVSSLYKTTWGISGRVTVRSTITSARAVPSMKGYITTERLDFLSGRSRAMFAERLNTLIPAPKGAAAIDWPMVVEELTARVMDAEHRQPVMRVLSEVPATSTTQYLLPFFLPDSKATILYGAGGTGKSIFANGLAAAIQTGSHFLGWKAKKRNVLYLDWETDEGDIAHRNMLVSRGLGLEAPAPVNYMSLEMPLELEMGHIAAAVVENKIGLVVIDSVGMASTQGRDGSDPAEGAIQFFRGLRMLNAAVLCIDHISGEDQRRGRAGATKPYGSVFKWNSARNAFEMIDNTPDGGPMTVMLRHRKANLGPRMNDMSVIVRWNDDEEQVFFRRAESTIPYVPLEDRIIGVLTTGPASYRNLLDLLNADQQYDIVTESTVRITSRELLASGKVTIDYAGVLRLVTEGDDPDATPEPLPMEEEAEV